MSLIARIEEELKAARLARDEDRRDALSLVLNALQAAKKELQRPLSDDEELQVLQRERKRRIEAAEAFRAAGREEQADDEEYELEILEEFMPEPMSEEEIEEIIDDVISEVGATSIRDMGRVMAGVMHQVSGARGRVDSLPARQGKAGLTPVPTLRPDAAGSGRLERGRGRARRRGGRRPRRAPRAAPVHDRAARQPPDARRRRRARGRRARASSTSSSSSSRAAIRSARTPSARCSLRSTRPRTSATCSTTSSGATVARTSRRRR